MLGLVVALFVLAITLLAALALAEREVVNDDFSLPDLSGPDARRWNVSTTESTGAASIGAGSLVTTVEGLGHVTCTSARPFACDNITLTLEWQWDSGDGEALRIAVESFVDGGYQDAIQLACPRGNWRLQFLSLGSFQTFWIGTTIARQGMRYNVCISLTGNLADVTVREGATGPFVASYIDFRMDGLRSRNRIALSTVGDTAGETLVARWDNVAVVDSALPPNTVPRWLSVGLLDARANLTSYHDFSIVIDDDQEPWELLIRSPSAHVVSSDGTLVGFLFPTPGMLVTVPLEVFDGISSAWNNVSFYVGYFNFPPEHDLPASITVPEGVPTRIDLGAHIWDRNDPSSSLVLIPNLPFVEVDGLMLIITAPEGSVRYELRLRISDGVNEVGAIIELLVAHFDAPPELLPIPTFFVEEDRWSTFGLMPYIKDPDTPVGLIAVGCDSPNCTVSGQNLGFLYTRGGVAEFVHFWVDDGTTTVHGNLTVIIVEVNDAPVMDMVPVQCITEDEPGRVSLDMYIHDEETDQGNLTLMCEHPSIVEVSGLELTFLFKTPAVNEVVAFIVTDGNSSSDSSFLLDVIPVNDPPVVRTIDGKPPPVNLTTYATKTLDVEVVYFDEEGGFCNLMLESDLEMASFHSRLLRIQPSYDEVGVHAVNIVVRDEDLAVGSAVLMVTVLDPSEVPLEVEFLLPHGGLTLTEGDSVAFSVRVSHPVMGYLSFTSVTWVSDLQGPLGTTDGSHDILTFSTMALLPGTHNISAVANSGMLRGEATVRVTVDGLPEERLGVPGSIYAMSFCIVMVVAGIAMAVAYTHSKRVTTARAPTPGTATVVSAPASPKPPLRPAHGLETRIQVVRPMPIPDEKMAGMPRIPSRTADAWSAGTDTEMVEGEALEVVFQAAPSPRAPIAPAPAATPGPAPPAPSTPAPASPPARALPPSIPSGASSKADMRASIAALKAVIEALPNGVPRELGLYDSYTIAERVLKGKTKMAPDGTPLVFVMGGWYVNTPDRPDAFLRPWKE